MIKTNNLQAGKDRPTKNIQLNENAGEIHIEKTSFHIPSLDGIRAFSILIVFLAHAGMNNYIPGYFGLSLFFFLSGYLITTLLRIEYDRTGTISLKQFYLRRALRILPPFYLVLIVATLLSYTGPLGGMLSANAILMQIFYLSNYQIILDGWWGGTAPGTDIFWSLAVEEHFYLAFPLFYLWLRQRGSSVPQQVMVLLGICFFILIWRCLLIFYFGASHDRVYVATDTRIDSILAGCVLAIYGNPMLDQQKTSDKMLAFIWLPVGIAAVLLSLLPRVHEFDQTIRYTLQSFGLVPFFIAAIRWHDRGVFRILNYAPVRYVGVLSYSLYLMHDSMLWGLEHSTTLNPWLRGVIAVLTLLGFASLIYRYLERPCARLRSRLSRYLETKVLIQPK